MENYLNNYVEAITTVKEFKHDYPELAEQAERAKANLRSYYPHANESDYIVIEVESYKCVAVILDNDLPYTVGEIIAPFDKNRIYPIQGLVTKFAFKRY